LNPRLINIIKYALSLSLLTWLIIRTDLQGVFDLWPDADLQDIAVALAMYLISVVIIAYRWQILLVAKQVPMAIRRAISLYFIGNRLRVRRTVYRSFCDCIPGSSRPLTHCA